ncbi:glycosyltransferase family A protein [Ornithinibacillus sp. JPR2-1]|uniref:glycosyltransferase family 2 protein n=1 Tax=Ornithinibacillus sp. JPR2-1 TaxID=2094019 RepID=UPI0031DFB323
MKYDAKKLKERNIELQNELEKLENQWLEQKRLTEESRLFRQTLEREFREITNSRIFHLKKIPSKWKYAIKESGAYILGRRDKRQLYSKTYKQKKASNKIKEYRYWLYTLGFEEKVLNELEAIFKDTDNRYMKQAVSWELALWHANKNSSIDAVKALHYLQALHTVNDDDFQRRVAILKAECYLLCEEPEQAERILSTYISHHNHPDLLLAMANLEKDMTSKLEWINKALNHYQLLPIEVRENSEAYPYDHLNTLLNKSLLRNGPTVTVIIPAYNAENSISISIESMLKQTWQNIEIIVVDDCSTDSTVKIVEHYIERDSRVKLFSTGKNSGPYVARNIGLKHATGEYLTVNDADDWSHAQKIAIQVEHLINNPSVIGNTSELARMTESLRLTRRGTEGEYIFSNMSSLMFRRKPVLEKLGAWDSVRFAADSEFKHRLMKVFGSQSVVDLHTGPLSFARQSLTSLTSSSFFGYNGFLMGIRKDYREAFLAHHQSRRSLYYDFPMKNRPFPVPEPLWVQREEKRFGFREFDVIMAADFRNEGLVESTLMKIQEHLKRGLKTGLIQWNDYHYKDIKMISPRIREIVDGKDVQFIVYGEQITCDLLILIDPSILEEKQRYLPYIKAEAVKVLIYQPPKRNGIPHYHLRKCAKHLIQQVDHLGKWYPCNQEIRESLDRLAKNDLKYIKLSKENLQPYSVHLDDWIVQENPFHLGHVKGEQSNE